MRSQAEPEERGDCDRWLGRTKRCIDLGRTETLRAPSQSLGVASNQVWTLIPGWLVGMLAPSIATAVNLPNPTTPSLHNEIRSYGGSARGLTACGLRPEALRPAAHGASG